MPYNINKTDGSLLVTVEDGTVDASSTSLTLLGKNYPGYGEILNENLVRLLENFSNSSPPAGAIEGQIWYDRANKTLKVWNGTDYIITGSSLQLDQNSSSLHYHMFVADASGTRPMKIAGDRGLVINPATGHIGISMSTIPGAKFTVNGGTNRSRSLQSSLNDAQIHIHGADFESAALQVDAYTGTVNQSASVTAGIILRSSRGTSISPTALQVNDFVSAVNSRGYNGSAYSTNVAGIVVRANQNWTSSANGTKIEFWTTNNNQTSHSPKVTIEHNGDLSTVGDIIAFNTSDMTLKQDVEPIKNALETLCQLDGIRFAWNQLSGKSQDIKVLGLPAQQVNELLPEAVRRKPSGYLGVDYDQLIPVLVEAIKDLKQQVDDLKHAR